MQTLRKLMLKEEIVPAKLMAKGGELWGGF